jgi:hypothetical protein
MKIQPHKPVGSRGRGRPSGYKPEYCHAVIKDMTAGFTLTAWAGSIGVSRETAYQWARVHPEFSDAVATGRAARQRYWEKRLMSVEAGAANSGIIFALRNCCQADWADRHEVQHSGAGGGAIPIEILERAREIAKANGA